MKNLYICELNFFNRQYTKTFSCFASFSVELNVSRVKPWPSHSLKTDILSFCHQCVIEILISYNKNYLSIYKSNIHIYNLKNILHFLAYHPLDKRSSLPFFYDCTILKSVMMHFCFCGPLTTKGCTSVLLVLFKNQIAIHCIAAYFFSN